MEAGHVIERPNRQKASSQSTRAIVVLLLLVSAALMLLVVIGGGKTLQGAAVGQLLIVAVYLLLAARVASWSRGALAVSTAVAVLLAILAAVATPAWFERDHSGYAAPQMLFGGSGLDTQMLGICTFLLIPLQVLLIAFAMSGFRQEWHVEVEVPAGRSRRGSLPAGA